MTPFSRTMLAAALAALAGCASTAPVTQTDPEKIRIYESVSSAPPVAATVKRLWIESWTSAFGVPDYRSAEEAAADLREHAARLGGDGVINFGCYRTSDAEDALLACNGTVVRFR